MGSVPTSRVHWFTLEEMRVPRAIVAEFLNTKMDATMISGASEARGASHCTSRNLSIPKLSPVARRPSAKGSAEDRITAAENRKSTIVVTRLHAVDSDAMFSGGPTSSGSTCSAREAIHRYTTKRLRNTTVSTNEIAPLKGIV